MKRWPLVISFVLFIVLCVSAAYWAMQLFKPPVRAVAAPPRVAKADVNVDAAASLFGGRAAKTAVASNYQLRGVIAAGTAGNSVAILSADDKPAQAIRAGAEVMPGVTVKEVHRDYVLLSENGVTKRVELPENEKAQLSVATTAPVGTQPAQRPAAAPRPSPPATVSPPPAPAPVPQPPPTPLGAAPAVPPTVAQPLPTQKVPATAPPTAAVVNPPPPPPAAPGAVPPGNMASGASGAGGASASGPASIPMAPVPGR